MKITCGTDIIEVNRIKNAIEKHGDRFLKEIFTLSEIEYCNNKANKYQHYAARFAAKEAVFKAISELLPDKYDIKWTDIEIKNNENQKPQVIFLKEVIQIEQIDISLSHVKEYAVANCVCYIK